MSKPDKDDWPQKKLSAAATHLIKGTDESARKPRRRMLDEGDDEINDDYMKTFSKDFSRLFDDPEKL